MLLPRVISPQRLAARLALVVTFLSWTRTAPALENKCSACVAVQNELVEILLEEKPKQNLDLRNRLNPKGQREGKIVEYKTSELRILEILEGLCERVKKYSLMKPDKEKKKKKLKKIWMHGQKLETPRLRMIAEEQGKELRRWCDKMLEMHEDEMAEMIREESNRGYKDVPILLCRNITKNCEDEETYLNEVKRMAPHLPMSGTNTSGPTVEVKSSPSSETEATEGAEEAGAAEAVEEADASQTGTELKAEL